MDYAIVALIGVVVGILATLLGASFGAASKEKKDNDHIIT